MTQSTLNRELVKRACDLVYTSVDDMQSGLWNYKGADGLQVLRVGLIIVNKHGEKTKAMILKRKIKNLEKELAKDGE